MGLLDRFFKPKKVVRIKDTGTPLVRYHKSFHHAVDGYFYALKEEHNMIIILLAGILTVIAGFILKISSTEWLFCIMIIGTVMGSELINTAIEATIDLTMPQIHPLAKIAKDTAGSATLIFAVTAFIGACVIFIPKIIVMF
ncbi:MAG: diacylglycerol kinase family protein [Bacilli bacterium]